jgi:hypothetical protein
MDAPAEDLRAGPPKNGIVDQHLDFVPQAGLEGPRQYPAQLVETPVAFGKKPVKRREMFWVPVLFGDQSGQMASGSEEIADLSLSTFDPGDDQVPKVLKGRRRKRRAKHLDDGHQRVHRRVQVQSGGGRVVCLNRPTHPLGLFIIDDPSHAHSRVLQS